MATSNARQFVKYDFYKVDSAWRRLPSAEREDNRQEFCAVVRELDSGMFIRSFSTVGLRVDADFLFWKASDTLEQV